MASAQNGTTAHALECRVNNIRYFIKTTTETMHCNGYAIAAKTKIRKSTKVKRLSHGARWKTKKIRKSLNSAYQKIVKWKKKFSSSTSLTLKMEKKV